MSVKILEIKETNLAVYTIKVVEAIQDGYVVDVTNYPVHGYSSLFEAYMIKDVSEEPDEGTPDAALLQHLVVAATVPKVDMRLKANRK